MTDHPLPTLRVGSQPCHCDRPSHRPDLVVVTGGPGAGKSAVLELAARSFCEHVAILPEAASIVFGGGFPRHDGAPGLRAAQLAIYAVQRQLENLVLEERQVAIALCDRGTLDGLAYWPDPPEALWKATETTESEELARYAAVVHLEVPSVEQGYQNDSIRVETAARAASIDSKIAAAWHRHGNRTVVPAGENFEQKASQALGAIRALLPPCCRGHRLVADGKEGGE